MAVESTKPPAEAVSSASVRVIEHAHKSLVQIRGRGTGAGVIWNAEGLVLTNHHVVAGRHQGGRVQVIPHDGRVFDAELVKRSQSLDLALLRIPSSPGDLLAAPVGDSEALRIGELVFAVGHPWGRLGAVTAGIVSGLGVVRGPGGRARYVQSDVSLAPGNSGGPLLNARGEVVGINAMIYGGLALSIPSNAASAWLADARECRPRLGLGVRVVPVGLRLGDQTGEVGLMIVDVEVGGPADRDGLLVGDVLIDVSGEPVRDPESLLDALARAENPVPLRVIRGGEVHEVEVGARDPGHAA
jgi:serine protease Do